ncbi:hypothetical protein ACFU3E_10165 [Streptomyces sp. NPDC057424]|uniref:hypothetical protein n=1 Tax=Streptomyces sp. NPDC057424 TaxID=3346127 RepID=UPI00367B401A
MDETRQRPVRRGGPAGGAATSLLAVAACAGHATNAELPWWAVLAVAVSTAGLAGWTGAQIGRRRGPRDEQPEPVGPMPGPYALPAARPQGGARESPLRMR